MSTLTQFYANPSPALACELALEEYARRDDIGHVRGIDYILQLRKAAAICRQHDELVYALGALLSRAAALDQSATHDGLQNAAVIANARAILAKVQA